MSSVPDIGPIETTKDPSKVKSEISKGKLGARVVTFDRQYNLTKPNSTEKELVKISFEIVDGTYVKFKELPDYLLPQKYKSVDVLKKNDLTLLKEEFKSSSPKISDIYESIIGALSAEHKKNPDIALGQTHLGSKASGTFQYTAKDNLLAFSEALDFTTGYAEWDEFDAWSRAGDQDWSQVMHTRFDKLLQDSGTIHFNLAGMEQDIPKLKAYDHTLETGSTENKLYSDTGWAKVFGQHGITQWELAQVINNKDLLQRTVFYNYDKTKDSVPIPLTPEQVAALGINETK